MGEGRLALPSLVALELGQGLRKGHFGIPQLGPYYHGGRRMTR